MATALEPSASRAISLGALELRPDAYRASLDGRTLCLSPSQLELLVYLVRNRDRVVSRSELAGAAGLEHGRSVDVALSGIRRELGNGWIRNIRNRGWILEPNGSDD